MALSEEEALGELYAQAGEDGTGLREVRPEVLAAIGQTAKGPSGEPVLIHYTKKGRWAALYAARAFGDQVMAGHGREYLKAKVGLVREALEAMIWQDEEGGKPYYVYDRDQYKWVNRAFEGLKLSGEGAPREEGLERLGITAEEADAELEPLKALLLEAGCSQEEMEGQGGAGGGDMEAVYRQLKWLRRG